MLRLARDRHEKAVRLVEFEAQEEGLVSIFGKLALP
jgi:hypothetical protein